MALLFLLSLLLTAPTWAELPEPVKQAISKTVNETIAARNLQVCPLLW